MRFFVSEKKHVVMTHDELALTKTLADAEQTKVRIELNQAKEYIKRLEREVEFYRTRYDEALERADRQLDGILAQAGLPEVTATTKKANAERDEKAASAVEKHLAELNEMFGESLDQMEEYDQLGLPSELQAEADKLRAGKK